MLPNLIVIGAAKCGTSSLHAYLDLHPDISMSAQKELWFFVEEKNWPRGLAWYESWFPGGTALRGEASPIYTAYPVYKGVPERMRRIVPDTKLIYLVRDPIERTISHYLHHRVRFPTPRTFADAVDDHRFIDTGRYWFQLEQYLAHFPAEQILVVDSDELRERREETMSGIFRFLGADPDFRSSDFELKHNRAAGRTRRNRGGRLALAAFQRALGPSRTAEVGRRTPAALKAPFRSVVERPAIDGALRERLVECFQDDVDRLRAHTGLPFAGWSL